MSTNIPKTVKERITKSLKQYQKVIEEAKARDVNESDTVTVVRDVLADVLGYDKYTEITSEYAIRGSYCDLAIKSGETPMFLIEVKAIGLDLKQNHLRQALSYGATQGVEWCVLTNGAVWQAHRLIFDKPVRTEQVFEIDLAQANPKDEHVIESLFLLSKEGVRKLAIEEFHEAQKATSRYILAAVLLSDPLLQTLRREVKRISKHVKADTKDLAKILKAEVIKRDALEGEEAEAAKKAARRAKNRSLKKAPRGKSAPDSKQPNEPVAEAEGDAANSSTS